MAEQALSRTGTILVVDDEQSILEVLEQFLSQRGYRVVAAETAEDALRRIGEEQFDAALIDLRLPDKTGLELIGAVTRSHPSGWGKRWMPRAPMHD
jgi:DNA-binding response OmpR family regulator